MKGTKLFALIYAFISFQLYLGISNNFTKSIFGVCANEVANLQIDLENTMLYNYVKSLYWKKIAHISQGLLLGIILLFNYDVSKLFDILLDNSSVICKNNTYKNILVTILSIVTLSLWQLDKLPFIIPAITLIYLTKIILSSCDKNQFNLILLVIACGYLLYNLGKRGYYYSNFIESSYFSNLFDLFVGMSISIILYGFLYNKQNDNLLLDLKHMYIIVGIFSIITLVVIYLIKQSKPNFGNVKTLNDVKGRCLNSNEIKKI